MKCVFTEDRSRTIKTCPIFRVSRAFGEEREREIPQSSGACERDADPICLRNFDTAKHEKRRIEEIIVELLYLIAPIMQRYTELSAAAAFSISGT